MEQERLQKIIAHAGFASRREAEEMIRTGRVTVNGKVVTELGSRADASRDHVKVDGKLITHAEEHRYILLYKPKEVMTTVDDPQGRRTVIELVKGVRERIYPIGRLDYHSEGLIILTNDGDLAFKVSHPKHGSVKTYHVKVRGVPDQRLVEKLERGITIDGKRTLPCEIARMKTTGKGDEEGNSWFEVKLREGRTQQIRKMFQVVGHPVSKLRRVAIGPLTDPKLTPGEWRELTPREVKMLQTMQEPPVRRTRAPRKKAAPAAAKKAAGAKAPSKRREAATSKRRETPPRRDAGGPRRETAGARREATGTRRESANTRREPASTRREASGGRRESTGARREATGSRRESGAPRREAGGARRETTTKRRETTTKRRETTTKRREGTSDKKPRKAPATRSRASR
ncbi:MAG TPA: pseudouridine synthase [Thermoanaerobaculia bacterium]